MSDTEAMLAALREAIKGVMEGDSAEAFNLVFDYGFDLEALLEEHVVRVKGEESAEILPCKHALPAGGSKWCHICGAWTEPVDAAKPEDGFQRAHDAYMTELDRQFNRSAGAA